MSSSKIHPPATDDALADMMLACEKAYDVATDAFARQDFDGAIRALNVGRAVFADYQIHASGGVHTWDSIDGAIRTHAASIGRPVTAVSGPIVPDSVGPAPDATEPAAPKRRARKAQPAAPVGPAPDATEPAAPKRRARKAQPAPVAPVSAPPLSAEPHSFKITHDMIEGTVLIGQTDRSYGRIMGGIGWKFSSAPEFCAKFGMPDGGWYVAGSKGKPADMVKITTAADRLRASGHTVNVKIDKSAQAFPVTVRQAQPAAPVAPEPAAPKRRARKAQPAAPVAPVSAPPADVVPDVAAMVAALQAAGYTLVGPAAPVASVSAPPAPVVSLTDRLAAGRPAAPKRRARTAQPAAPVAPVSALPATVTLPDGARGYTLPDGAESITRTSIKGVRSALHSARKSVAALKVVDCEVRVINSRTLSVHERSGVTITRAAWSAIDKIIRDTIGATVRAA